MGATEVVRAGECSPELLEAIALVAGVYGGAVFLPAEFVGTDPLDVRREMVSIFDKVHVQVDHLARHAGGKLYEGFSFTNMVCPIRMRLGAQRWEAANNG